MKPYELSINVFVFCLMMSVIFGQGVALGYMQENAGQVVRAWFLFAAVLAFGVSVGFHFR